MATGDKKNAVEKLRHELESIKFDFEKGWNLEAIANGDPTAFMNFARYAVLGFSRSVSTYFTVNQLVLDSQSDVAFMESIMRLMRREFQQNPAISIEQFFQAGFVEHKALLCRDLVKHCKKLHNELYKKRKEEKERGRTKAEGDIPRVGSMTMGDFSLKSVTQDPWPVQSTLKDSRATSKMRASSTPAQNRRSASVGLSPATPTPACPSLRGEPSPVASSALSPPLNLSSPGIINLHPSPAEFQQLVAMVTSLQHRVAALEQQVLLLTAERQVPPQNPSSDAASFLNSMAHASPPQLIPRHGSISLARTFAAESHAPLMSCRPASAPRQRPADTFNEGESDSPAPVNGGSLKGGEGASVPATAAKIIRTQELLKGHGIDLTRIAAHRPGGMSFNPLSASSFAPQSGRENPLSNLPIK